MNYSSCYSLYRDSSYSPDCYEFATVGEMNGITGAVPIPASTAQRIFDTNIGVDSTGRTQSQQVQSQQQVQQQQVQQQQIQALATTALASSATPEQAAVTLMAAAAQAQSLRYNRRF